MKVFLSWSGEISRLVAEALREWLPNMLQAIDPWMSAEDIDKGARWSSDIAGELSNTRAGIICVTAENLGAPWLNFEAGALSKTLDKTLVCPYLIGLQPADLRGPLVQFQAAVAERGDTRRLMATINAALGKDALPDKQLDKAFDVWWPELEANLNSISSMKTTPKSRRSEREILEEILALVRFQSRQRPLAFGKLPGLRLGGLARDPSAPNDWPQPIVKPVDVVLYGGGEALPIKEEFAPEGAGPWESGDNEKGVGMQPRRPKKGNTGS